MNLKQIAIMAKMTYDEFKLYGCEVFSEFRYYKGEEKNPCNFSENNIEYRWWNFEKDYFDNYKDSGTWKTFMEFFNHWIKEKAAPEIGYDLDKGNKWLTEYNENALFRSVVYLDCPVLKSHYKKKDIIMADFTMYRFFKGEKANPFDSQIDWVSAKFWYYEYVFDSSFFRMECSDLYSFFKDHDMGKEFMTLLSEDEHDYLSEKSKKPVFELWLKYLFKYKLYPEYGGENKLEMLYFSTDL